MNKNFISCLTIFFICIFSFINTINNKFVNYDDHNYILENQRIKGEKITDAFALFNPVPFIKGTLPKKLNEYLPVRDLTYWFDYQLWGLNPSGYHLTNLIFYVFLCIAIFFLFIRITKNYQISLLSAIFYVIHPLHTENVAWVSARKDIISALFYVLSFIAYLNFSTSEEKKLRRAWYFLSFLFFIAGWLSKPLIIALPAIFVLYGIFERKKIKKIILETLIFWAFDIFFFTVNTIVVKGVTPLLKGTAPGLFAGINYVGYYLYLLLVPHKLVPIREPLYTFSIFHLLISIIFLIFLFIFTIKNKRLLFSLLFFLINLAPVLNLTAFANYSVHDRYMLIPSFGIFPILVSIITEINKERIRNFVIITLLTPVVFFTMTQNTHWKESITLWQHTLRFYPDSSIAHLNLGAAYSDIDKNEEAEIEYWTVINLSHAIHEIRSSAYYNLGLLKLKSEKLKEALIYFENALNDSPEPGRIHRIMGGIYVKLREPEKAIEHYEISLKLDPNQPDRYLTEEILKKIKSLSLPERKP